MGKIKDIIGLVFGTLKVIKLSYQDRTHSWYLIECDCGSQKEMRRDVIIKADSCGCIKNQATSMRNKANPPNLKHGQNRKNQKTLTYATWQCMIRRCVDPNNNRYQNYGGKGIKVCDQWLNSFENFFHDMGKRPGSDYSIDRIDNNGNYEPKNCRWITKSENTRLSNLNRIKNRK